MEISNTVSTQGEAAALTPKKPGSGSGGDPVVPPNNEDTVTLSAAAVALSSNEKVYGSGSGGDPS
jgi:hypothetical protein